MFNLFALALLASACSSSPATPASADAVSSADTGLADALADATADTLAPPQDASATVDAAQDATVATDAVVDAQSDAVGDAGADAAATPPPTTQRWGVRLRAPVLGLRTVERSLWLGMTAILDPDDPSKVRAGLARYDLDTGEVVRYEAELPQVVYDDFAVTGLGPVSTAAAVGDGQRVLVVARQGVLVFEAGAFTLKPVVFAGTPAAPISLVVDRRPGIDRLWVATNHGLVRMHADTFAVEKVYGEAELGSQEIGSLALDPTTGAVYAAVYLVQGSLLARVDDVGIQKWTPGEDGTPKGRVGELAFSVKGGAVYAAVASWDATTGGVVRWNGTKVETMATEGQLATAAVGESTAFGASVLALDDANDMLVVGGQIHKKGILQGLEGGGLAFLHLGAKDMLAGASVGNSDLGGDHVVSVAWDPITRRVFLSSRQPCNDIKLGNVGIQAAFFDSAGKLHVERPILSGVRATVRVGGETWASLRDDLLGLSCEGHPVQQGLVRLNARRGGEVVHLTAQTADEGADASLFRTERFGANTMEVLDDQHIAWAGWKYEMFFGDPAGGRITNPAISLSTSLIPYDVSWLDPQTLWVTSRATHDAGESASLADVGPRGAARIELGAKGDFTSHRYVAVAKNPNDIGGMPSSEVTAAIVAKDGSTWLVCGTERSWAGSLDRVVGEPYVFPDGKTRLGGVAQVDAAGKLQVVADGAVVPDGRAAARDADGRLVVVDATKGLLRLQTGAFQAIAWPAAIPAKAFPTSLWLGADAAMVASFHQGLLLHFGSNAWFTAEHGGGWHAGLRAPGLILVGTDEGLLRVREAGAAEAPELPPATAALPQFKNVPVKAPVPIGECVPQHGPCGKGLPCCEGTTCSFGFVQTCE